MYVDASNSYLQAVQTLSGDAELLYGNGSGNILWVLTSKRPAALIAEVNAKFHVPYKVVNIGSLYRCC